MHRTYTEQPEWSKSRVRKQLKPISYPHHSAHLYISPAPPPLLTSTELLMDALMISEMRNGSPNLVGH